MNSTNGDANSTSTASSDSTTVTHHHVIGKNKCRCGGILRFLYTCQYAKYPRVDASTELARTRRERDNLRLVLDRIGFMANRRTLEENER